MEDIGLVKQGWKWLQTQKHVYSRVKTAVGCLRDKIGVFIERHWPMVCSGCARFGRLMRFMLIYWKDCATRGFNSVIKLGSAALLLIMWSCFLSLTSMSCLLYVLLCMGAAGAAVQYLGYTPGLFIVGLFAILILWMYANFWITGTLFIVGGYLFSLNHARLVVLMATIYAIYCVKVRVGWHGVFLSINLTFFSNDVLNFLLQWCDNVSESTQFEEHKESETVLEDEFSVECEFSIPVDESEKVQPCKSSSPAASSSVHWDFLATSRIDVAILKKEYHKKAMRVHPDKNMGSPLASESFKKLQCAYEVLSDSVKKRDYDEQLRREESKTRSVCQKSHVYPVLQPLNHTLMEPEQDNDKAHEYSLVVNWQGIVRLLKVARGFFNLGNLPPKSKIIQITALRNPGGYSAPNVAFHIYGCALIGPRPRQDGVRIAANIIKPKMEMDGLNIKAHWSSIGLKRWRFQRAFVCAESKIFDVSEWAICQGMQCRPNTHRPSFHVNMVGLEKTQRSNSSRYPWDLDAEMMDEDEEEFELWLQQALASGLFCETSKRRKSWSPFKLPQKKGKKQWRRTST
ncbi:hypothetical protein H0E87_000044 [Populus deltoides]|uniref:J domain-containing protein n=1 Tax=Populus deltoides TaxID=3696 RepID=A0A8T2ZL87_POPDE|nr:hypothetical protein H0E87_000044 [Populus deltoides]